LTVQSETEDPVEIIIEPPKEERPKILYKFGQLATERIMEYLED
jgi:hypothetical protein